MVYKVFTLFLINFCSFHNESLKLITDIITNGDLLAKIIFGDSSHALLSMSNATNCRQMLVSNIAADDTYDETIN
jgi:hypothetical protein